MSHSLWRSECLVLSSQRSHSVLIWWMQHCWNVASHFERASLVYTFTPSRGLIYTFIHLYTIRASQCLHLYATGASQLAPVVKNPPAHAGDIRGAGLIPGGGHGKPLQYSCLENPRQRSLGCYSAEGPQGWTRLKWLSTLSTYHLDGLPWWLGGKESAYNVGDSGSIPGLGKIPWRRKWQPTLVFLPWESHRQWILVGYSPWVTKELDMS